MYSQKRTHYTMKTNQTRKKKKHKRPTNNACDDGGMWGPERGTASLTLGPTALDDKLFYLAPRHAYPHTPTESSTTTPAHSTHHSLHAHVRTTPASRRRRRRARAMHVLHGVRRRRASLPRHALTRWPSRPPAPRPAPPPPPSPPRRPAPAPPPPPSPPRPPVPPARPPWPPPRRRRRLWRHLLLGRLGLRLGRLGSASFTSSAAGSAAAGSASLVSATSASAGAASSAQPRPAPPASPPSAPPPRRRRPPASPPLAPPRPARWSGSQPTHRSARRDQHNTMINQQDHIIFTYFPSLINN